MRRDKWFTHRLVLMLWVCSWSHAQAADSSAAILVEKENIVSAQMRGLPWNPAPLGIELGVGDKLRTGEFSRAAVRFTDLSMLRIDELTTIEVSAPVSSGKQRTLELKRGGIFFFSREKPQELQIRTPAANGALRGTEFALRVAADGKTTLSMFDGEVELSNAQGKVLLKSGEQGEAEIGKAPRKTAVIEAVNIIQWCLYYPGVLDPAAFVFSKTEQRALGSSLEAYRAGDLLGALTAYPLEEGRGSVHARLYYAAVVLSTGRVDKAQAALAAVPADDPGRRALDQMIAAVKLQDWTRAGGPATSSEWMAESYFQQSRGDLTGAMQSARKAIELSPEFGFAWARVAELEFSFGHTLKAMKLAEHSLELAPRNAQAHALQGFLLSAENRIGAARRSFDDAILLDGALGNAWLGRGLTFIRQGHEEEGRRDLQTAAALEPNRSILRSYLGKAFSQVGRSAKANVELERAKEIDPNDPTPWLYSAIERKQENRYNEAVDDLEKSVALNDNRRIYRSQFLLDQDRSIRGTNLAAIYLNDGMTEQSVREAVRAVDGDYASAPAHLFLANSYNALRDPARVQLRYETAWFNELLLSNLLSPVGGGPLSQFVSEQEYSKMFEKEGFGISSVTDYLSTGEVNEAASQYGRVGNLSYALDGERRYSNGVRPNNSFWSTDGVATFKLQLGPQDTAFFQTTYGDVTTGNGFQYYDPRDVSFTTTQVQDINGVFQPTRIPNRAALTLRSEEKQDPGLLLFGLHHEWSPGNHTLLLFGRLANRQEVTDAQINVATLTRDVTLNAPPDLVFALADPNVVRTSKDFARILPLVGRGDILAINSDTFDLDYHSSFETYSAEMQQIFTFGPDTLLLGGRYQHGQFETRVRLSNFDNGLNPFVSPLFENPPADQDAVVDFDRLSLYLYDILRVTRWLSITGGVAYDKMEYPDNFRDAPINDRQAELGRVSPKAGVIVEPWTGATIRGAYTQGISGTSFDESVRLEPTQVAGFLQAYRSIISESLIGSVAGNRYELSGLSLEQKLPTRTYFGVEFNMLEQNLERTRGIFNNLESEGIALAVLPASTTEKDHYREESVTATLNQLVGDCWSFGARYRYTHSELRQQLPELRSALNGIVDPAVVNDLARNSQSRSEAGFHELSLYALYNHPCGFFARAEANWYQQQNDDFITSATATPPDSLGVSHALQETQNRGRAGDDFWQFNAYLGYRFYRNQCELSGGLLNITGQDYRLNPLNSYAELPREQTFVLRCKLTF